MLRVANAANDESDVPGLTATVCFQDLHLSKVGATLDLLSPTGQTEKERHVVLEKGMFHEPSTHGIRTLGTRVWLDVG